MIVFRHLILELVVSVDTYEIDVYNFSPPISNQNDTAKLHLAQRILQLVLNLCRSRALKSQFSYHLISFTVELSM